MRLISISAIVLVFLIAGIIGYIYFFPTSTSRIPEATSELQQSTAEKQLVIEFDLFNTPSEIPYAVTEKEDAELELILKSTSPTGISWADRFYFRPVVNTGDLFKSGGGFQTLGSGGDKFNNDGTISPTYNRSMTIETREHDIQIDISTRIYDSKENLEHQIKFTVPYMTNNTLHQDGYSYEWSWGKIK